MTTTHAPAIPPADAPGARRIPFGSVLAAEGIKIGSTRSPRWVAFLAVGAVAGAAFVGTLATTNGSWSTRVLAGSGRDLGLMILLVGAVLVATTDFRFGTARTTAFLDPGRVRPLVAKAILVGVGGAVTAIVALVTAIVASYAAGMLAGVSVHVPLDGETLGMIGRAAAAWGLLAVCAMAAGHLVRRSAGAISLALLWILLVENLLSMAPRIGKTVARELPFVNTQEFQSPGRFGDLFPVHSPSVAIAVLAAWAFGLLVAAALAHRWRDQ